VSKDDCVLGYGYECVVFNCVVFVGVGEVCLVEVGCKGDL